MSTTIERLRAITSRDYTSTYALSGNIVAHNSPQFDFDDWRWRDDDGDESSTGARFLETAGTSHDFDVNSGNVIARLRVAWTETNAGAQNNAAATLQYNVGVAAPAYR